MQKENRVIIFYHPDLIEAIVSCAIENSGEIRMAACSVLAMIAKSGHLREPMAQVEDLLDVLADSLLGADSQKAASSKNLDEVHENEANHASDEFSSESDSSTDDSASESETSYGNISSRNKQHSHSAKLKKKEIEEKKKEIKKQVTSNACAALLHLSKQCAASVSEMIVKRCAPIACNSHQFFLFPSTALYVSLRITSQCTADLITAVRTSNAHKMFGDLV